MSRLKTKYSWVFPSSLLLFCLSAMFLCLTSHFSTFSLFVFLFFLPFFDCFVFLTSYFHQTFSLFSFHSFISCHFAASVLSSSPSSFIYFRFLFYLCFPHFLSVLSIFVPLVIPVLFPNLSSRSSLIFHLFLRFVSFFHSLCPAMFYHTFLCCFFFFIISLLFLPVSLSSPFQVFVYLIFLPSFIFLFISYCCFCYSSFTF